MSAGAYSPLDGDYKNTIRDPADSGIGLVESKPTISWKDVISLGVSLTCLGLGAASIFQPHFAVFLGQTNQLIVIGFLLAIMGYCTQVQVRHLSFLIEAHFGESTLQDYQALLLNDAWDRNIGILPQFILLSLFALPLGLSASYKNYVGGFTSLDVSSSDAGFGLTAEPGKQRIGNGLSLLVDAYLPYWIDPAFPRTYGFNMYVHSNTTTALLDGPLPAHIRQLQSTLASGNSLLLTARVNATVAQLSPLSMEERHNSTLWNQTYFLYDTTSEALQYSADLFSGANSGILSEQFYTTDGVVYYTGNNSQMFMALWNTTLNETFESTAQRILLSRRQCTGVWNITSSAISLQSGLDLQDAAAALTDTDQSLIQNNRLGLEGFFGPFIAEYDWHNRGSVWDDPLPGTSSFHRNVSTVSALAATMAWARLVSLDGPERTNESWNTTSYAKMFDEIRTRKIVETLKHSAVLLVILSVHPLLTILAMVGRRWLYSVPIGEGFGIISLLGGIRPDDLHLLKGSTLSGKLAASVKLHFQVDDSYMPGKTGTIQVRLGEADKSGKVRKRVKYG